MSFNLRPWTGGLCPVNLTQVVAVVLQDGTKAWGQAGSFDWSKKTGPNSILNYVLIYTDVATKEYTKSELAREAWLLLQKQGKDLSPGELAQVATARARAFIAELDEEDE